MFDSKVDDGHSRSAASRRLCWQAIVALVVTVVAPVLVPTTASAAPANDAFVGAEVLGGPLPISVAGSNLDATKEAGEPNHAGNAGGASVWYRWTPDASGPVVIETCASSFDTVLGVYTGTTVDALAHVASNDDAANCGSALGSRVGFTATAGVPYLIAVDGYGGRTGSVALTIRATTAPGENPPVNDSYADASVLSGVLPITATGTNVDASSEAGEPNHAGVIGGTSVWFAWTPDESGPVAIETCGSGFDTLLGVYTGTVVSDLTVVASNNNTADCGTVRQSKVTFLAAAGETYRIAVDGVGGVTGSIALTVRASSGPANDDFAEAEVLSGSLPISVSGTNVEATKEAGEPNHAGNAGGASVWYSWTAAAAGTVAIETCGSQLNTLLGVYVGTDVASLATEVANDDTRGCGEHSFQSRVMFAATAGETYRIAIDGRGGSTFPFAMTIRAAIVPANDDFADAQVLSGPLPITVEGTNLDASKEAGEPNHAGSAGGASVWFSWTPEASGSVAIDTCASYWDTYLAVYSGDAVGALMPVTSNDDFRACGNGAQSRVLFAATAGATYRIAVDGFDFAQVGPLELTIRAADRVPNDDFADAQTLDGPLPVGVTGTNLGATFELDEPDHADAAGGASVWYSWMPSSSSPVVVDTCASGFDTVLAVYTGEAVDALTAVASNDSSSVCGHGGQSRVAFTASAGQLYRIAVDGDYGAMGTIRLTIGTPVPPTNDDFDDAAELSGSVPITVGGTNVDATKEAGEPDHTGDVGGASVWFSWTPDFTGPVVASTCGSNLDTLLAVYSGGAVDALSAVASNDNGCGAGSLVRFAVTAGSTYRIAVDGSGGDVASFVLVLRRPPANDAVADAEALSGPLPLGASGSNLDATAEPGEPDHGDFPARASVWYRWTPEVSGLVVVETCGSTFNTVLAVYAGSALEELTPVASNDDSCGVASHLTFMMDAATTYSIAVDGASFPTRGSITLTLRTANPPANDDFANAQALTGVLPINVAGTNDDATTESDEPQHAGQPGGGSLWYRWTPTVSDTAEINLCASNFDTLLGVYTGSELDDLTTVVSNDDWCGPGAGSRVRFPATAGETYWIAVDGWAGATGSIGLSLRVVPSNDDFADAQVLRGALPITVAGSNVDAWWEEDEPQYQKFSVWYSWTAEVSGPVVVETCGSSFDTTLDVYTGDDVGGLTPVAYNDNANTEDCWLHAESRVIFAAAAGETYRIAVDSYGPGGSIVLTLRSADAGPDAPENDDFADAEVLSGALPIEVAGSNVDASRELDEPYLTFGEGGASVWYRWTPESTREVVVTTCGSELSAVIGVYDGDALADLAVVADAQDNCGATQRSARFSATAGETYRIAVEGNYGRTGPFTLTIRDYDPPGNDDFADAEVLTGALPIEATGSSVDATEQLGEPYVAGGASVWYRWTSDASGPVTIETCGSDFDTHLAVYTGTAVNDLVEVASNRNTLGCGAESRSRVTFSATAGTTYRIAVDGFFATTGAIALTIRTAIRPPNDDFAEAQPLTGALPIHVTGINVDATVEIEEPDHGSYFDAGTSVWYAWTADTSGPVVIETCGSGFHTTLAVYTGTDVPRLTEVVRSDAGCGAQSRVGFEATEGQTYRIAVGGQSSATGPISLTVREPRPPANDRFGDAEVLEGALPINVSRTTVDASREAGEADHAFATGGASVWYRWTPASTGSVVIETCGSDFDTLLGVYTGSHVNALAEVASGSFGCDSGRQSSASFVARAGQTYRIAVDGPDGASGSVVLSIRARPANDDIHNAVTLSGRRPVRVTGTNVDATSEPGEPRHTGTGGSSVWYAWTAARTAPVVVETCGSQIDTLLAVYTGSAVNRLTAIAGNDDACGSGSRVRFVADAGQTYWIAVDGAAGATGAFRLAIRPDSGRRS